MPFALFYSHYLCCVHEQKMESNNFKWGAAFIVWNLANMFSDGKSEAISFESICDNIGMFSYKKKTTTKLTAEAVLTDKEKAYNAIKNVFGISME